MNQDLVQVIDTYFADWTAGNITEMVEHLTEDSVYHPMNSPTIQGREGLTAFYQDFVDNFDIALNWEFEAADADGALGYVVGTYFIRYSPTGTRDEISRGGRFYMQMERGADSRWRIARELTQPTEDRLPTDPK